VYEGEIFGLAGHNGAGKSTTLSIITGATKMDPPGYSIYKNDKESTSIVNNAWLNDFSIRDEITSVRKMLGYCPQFNTNVYLELSLE
jgi:ABC-type multidrug transport system ATPase subunit